MFNKNHALGQKRGLSSKLKPNNTIKSISDWNYNYTPGNVLDFLDDLNKIESLLECPPRKGNNNKTRNGGCTNRSMKGENNNKQLQEVVQGSSKSQIFQQISQWSCYKI